MNGQFGVSALLHAAVEAEREIEIVLNHAIMFNQKILRKLKTVAWTIALQVIFFLLQFLR